MPNDTLVSFRTFLASEISSKPIVKGSIILCSDSGEIYWDTPDGERILIARSIVYFANDTERTQLLTPEANILYIVRDTGRIWIWSNSAWVNINAPTTTYFDLDNVEVPTGSTGVTVKDSRITSKCTATFAPIEALYDLATEDSVSVTCTCADGSVTAVSTCAYPLIGKIKVVK